MQFRLISENTPKGDQPEAIRQLVQGINTGVKDQVLLGITGSGKTFTIANLINETQRPTLVLAHNKTLAAQLYQEFKSFFPDNAVEYFVSYYDYYQPEAYVPASDLYIEKEATINEEIDRLRLSATRALFERRDVIVVASVSCIYGLGDPDAYFGMLMFIEPGMQLRREDFLQKLVELQYERVNVDFDRGSFRVRGDVVEIYPSYQDQAYRVEFWGDEIDSISTIDPLLGEVLFKHESRLPIYPKTHYVMSKQTIKQAVKTIRAELDEHEKHLVSEGKVVESQRLHQRTMYDLEMIKEMGFCRGIENYSRHLTGKKPGEPPPTLLDYLPENALMVIDESHQTIPQVGAMFKGDQSRKGTLVEYGFRLPSAKDNRPLNFQEFEARIGQTIYVSATPGPYELQKTQGEVIEQTNRRVLEALIRAGAMDSLGANRATLMNQLPAAIQAAEQQSRAQAAGQDDLFGLAAPVAQVAGDDSAAAGEVMPEWSEAGRLAGAEIGRGHV